MITLFSVPKAFEGHIGIIQRNAVESWTRLCPRPEIILFGNEAGIERTASEFGVLHCPSVTRNACGTPCLNGVFSQVHKMASYPVLGQVNADIILMSDFMEAVTRVAGRFKRFFMFGIRHDLDIDEAIPFKPGWEADLRQRVSERGELYTMKGTDFHVFTSGIFEEIPPFAVGRTVWDNWLIYRARSKGVPVIDATPSVLSVHQNHDIPSDQGRGIYEGPEAVQNHTLAGGASRIFTYADATHILTPGGVKPALSPEHIKNRLKRIPVLRRAF